MFTRSHKEKAAAVSRKVAGQPLSLLRFARANGSNHAQWILHAVQELCGKEGVERAGVWLDLEPNALETHAGPLIFRGEVWERGIGNGPPEWTRLSEDLLPKELVREGKSCEYDLEGPYAGLIVGPLLGLRRALWVPIVAGSMLRGMVLVGSRSRQAPSPRAEAERIAEELGVLLELQESQRIAAARQADLELHRRLQTLTTEGQSGNIILAQLAETCTRRGALGGVGAVFALIGERNGERVSGLPSPALPTASENERLAIRAQSGESDWAHRVRVGPLETLWRHAFEQQRVIGTDAERGPQDKETLRIVAIPLGRGKEIRGVLLAALPGRKATLESLERLELRSMLAAEVFEEERRVEAATQQERWYRALLESSQQPLVLVDERGLLRGISQGAQEILRNESPQTDAAPGALRLAEFFRPGHRERVQQWLKSGAGEKPGHEQYSLEGELNTGEAVVLSRMPVSGEKFSVIRLERLNEARHPHKIEEVQEELRQAIEWLEEGVVIFDENGGILARNLRFLQILGVSEKQGRVLRNLEELIRESADNFAAPEQFAAEWRALGKNGATGTQEELPMEKPMPQVIERCTRPIIAADGKKLGRVEVYREVTARRMFQSRMLQAEKLAALGQRATAILHELSNPLTAILGNAQRMILRGELGTHSAEAHRILEEAERATAILRQLLLLSRETRPDRRLISLNELVRHAVDLQRTALFGSHVLLQVDTAAGLPRVSGDAGQLQQALLNLLQNAQQAIEQSGRGSTIGVRTSAVTPDRVRLEVWDDGPGIPETIQARIFDPFFTTKPEGVGTGLGLAIVSGFVRLHGGSISVFCPPEGGSRFIVELPVAEEMRTRQALPIPESPSRSDFVPMAAGNPGRNPDLPPGGNAPHVLVVEDETTVADLIADVLREEGMNVDVLLDGRKAVEAARSARYDLVICDLKMPEMDGQSFYGKLQQDQNPLREHVLFVTGDLLAQRTQEFLERHHLPHLAKPFRVEELTAAVRQVLGAVMRAPAAGMDTTEALGNGIGP